MTRIPVRIESREEGKEFQKFIFARGWKWSGDFVNVSDYFVPHMNLLYFLYPKRKRLTYSNSIGLTEDYENSISVREAKARLFMPSIIEVDE